MKCKLCVSQNDVVEKQVPPKALSELFSRVEVFALSLCLFSLALSFCNSYSLPALIKELFVKKFYANS